MERAEEKQKERWVDIGGDLIEAYRNLLTIKIVEKASLGASFSIVGLFSLISISLILLFAGLGSAWWVGEQMENMIAGFFIVVGVYAVILACVLLATKKVIVPKIRNFIIKKMYEQD